MAKTRRRTTEGALIALLLVCSGCVTFRPPTFRVAELRLSQLTLRGGTLGVSLDVENPNGFALESRALRYAIAFADARPGETDMPDWVTLAEGEVADPVRVPAGETGRVELSIPFDMVSLGAAVQRLLRQGELEYRFSGELRAATPLGIRRIPFDQKGRFRP